MLKRKPIIIGNNSFRFKKDAISHYRHILNSYNFKESLDERQKEYFMREQIKIIREELGEGGYDDDEADELTEKMAKKKMPDFVREKLTREIDKMRKKKTHIKRVFFFRVSDRARTDDIQNHNLGL